MSSRSSVCRSYLFLGARKSSGSIPAPPCPSGPRVRPKRSGRRIVEEGRSRSYTDTGVRSSNSVSELNSDVV